MTLYDATSARHYHWEVEFVKLTNRLKGIISNARYVFMKEIKIKSCKMPIAIVAELNPIPTSKKVTLKTSHGQNQPMHK